MRLLEIVQQIESLESLVSSGVISPDIAKENIFKLKESAVLRIHPYKISVRKTGRYCTRILNSNCKQKSAKSYEDLILKLYNLYYELNAMTLERLFPDWVQYRYDESSVSQKTVKENVFIWNSLLADSAIVKKPLVDLKPLDFVVFFRKITKNRQLTKKRFNDMKSILNNMFYYAIEREIVFHNPLLDINYRQFAYKSVNTNIIPYSQEERKLILSCVNDSDLYDLAIKFFFYFTIRIGELKGLRFDDVKGNWLNVQRFVNDQHEVIDDIKGHAAEGRRLLPIPDEAKKLIAKIRLMNPDSEYLFMTDVENSKFITTVTFNRRLKHYCDVLDIPYRSSHKLRFSTASILHKNGVGIPELQKLLGHTSASMTEHYLRDVSARDETFEKVTSIFA